MFNEAKPKMFTVLTEFDKIADELERAAEKFRTADAEYDGNLVEDEIVANAASSEITTHHLVHLLRKKGTKV